MPDRVETMIIDAANFSVNLGERASMGTDMKDATPRTNTAR